MFENRHLPGIQNTISWDDIADNYLEHILSPFAAEMITGTPNNQSRNLLLNYLHTIPVEKLTKAKVLDLGCGPGNIIPHIADKIGSLTAIDISKKSLTIAKRKACEFPQLNFEAIHSNILNYHSLTKYDFIITINSVLPDTRDQVIQIFQKIKSLLSHDGLMLAILPSFDTLQYLKSLFIQQNTQLATEIETSFKQQKLFNDLQLSYADDGLHSQCYHTPESIKRELALAGLKLKHPLQKVYYPWDLCRHFDYGYFPDAEEEIWDWFLVAGHV